ncbi:MAG: hypothetical protein R2712_21050 [Vicinamibacterales bacterium]
MRTPAASGSHEARAGGAAIVLALLAAGGMGADAPGIHRTAAGDGLS